MKFSLSRLLLPLLLAFAFVVRWEPARTLRLAPDEQQALGDASWLIDDPDTCQELRRIELAIAGARVPDFDRFVNYPAGGEIPSLSFFDACVAGVAQRFLPSSGGDVALGFVREHDLEDFVIKLSSILGLLAVLAVFWAARTIATGRQAVIAALAAAAVVALHPATIAVSSAGILDSAALLSILFAFLLRSTVRSIRATGMPGALLDALVAGALAGILTAGSAVGLALFFPAWTAFLVHVLRSEGEARTNALRCGLFFTIVAAFLARMPISEPRMDAGGIVTGFQSGAALIVFLSAAPFLVLFLLNRGAKSSLFRTACFIVATGVIVYQAPKAWDDLAPAVRWFFAEHALITRALPSTAPSAFGFGLAFLVAVGIVVVAVSWRHRSDTTTLALGGAVVVLLLVSLATALALPFLVVALACAVALALDRAGDEDTPAARRVVPLAAALFVLLAVPAFAPSFRTPDPVQREARLDFVAGLRWMRANTTSGGAWNSPTSPSSWGVVCSVSDGPLVQYHARRPALLSPWAVLSGPRAMEEATRRMNASGDRAPLERLMQGQGAPYVVVGAGERRRERDLVSAAQPTVLDELLRQAAGLAPRGPDEFVLEHVSRRRLDAAGASTLDEGAGLPVIAIWRLARQESETPRAEMRPR